MREERERGGGGGARGGSEGNPSERGSPRRGLDYSQRDFIPLFRSRVKENDFLRVRAVPTFLCRAVSRLLSTRCVPGKLTFSTRGGDSPSDSTATKSSFFRGKSRNEVCSPRLK